jgi:hypothetical protein
MKLKEFKVTNISELYVVVRTQSDTFGLNPKETQITLAEKMSDILVPDNLVEIVPGEKTFFKVKEEVIEINHDGKVLSGQELKLNVVNESLNESLNETKDMKIEKIINDIKDLSEEVKKEVNSSETKEEQSINKSETEEKATPRRGRKKASETK